MNPQDEPSGNINEPNLPKPSPPARFKLKLITREGVIRIAILLTILLIVVIAGTIWTVKMPGKSYAGAFAPLTPAENRYRDQMVRDLKVLAVDIGERNVFIPKNLERAASFLEQEFRKAGYQPQRQTFPIKVYGEDVSNIEVEIRGASRPGEIVVVGAHYDSVQGTIGADDNGTGVVGVLALARAFAGKTPARTLRFVQFVNEEPPFFMEYQEKGMGSWEYARRCRARGEKIVAMISLETMSFYSDVEGSQKYPPPFNLFYPSTGNFIVFVGNMSSRRLVCQCVATFRANTPFPSEGTAALGILPGIGWSDHWAFWQEGYPALMVTDTGPFRNYHYHTVDDTIDKVDFDRLARVVAGLERVVAKLVAAP